jgi:dinuclear metal center YbgI/SA1388 family protein
MPTVADVADFLRSLAPLHLAASWDNVGLLLGEEDVAVVERIMTCLTVTPETAVEATNEGVQLLVTHHPIFFRPVKRLTAQTPEGSMLLALASHGVAVYSPHTAWDNAAGGINDLLAQKLGLTQVTPLRPGQQPGRCKLVVFVPDADLGKVSDAMFAAGAGRIGQYSECSFRLSGTGTFFGSDATNPTVGQKGRREEVSEWRLEAICAEADVDRVVAAMRQAHSYEEPAYDVYPLRSETARAGEGRLGKLPHGVRLAELARQVKEALGATVVQAVGGQGRLVQRIAVACGAGGEFLGDAVRQGADVLLTGEMRFHDCLAAQASSICLILPGHYATERCGVEHLAQRLQQQFPALQVWASRREHDPLAVV